MTQTLTDRAALLRHRQRAASAPVTFLHDLALEDVQDRLKLVNKTFQTPSVISGAPEIWNKVVPGAQHSEDAERLDLEPGTKDLVIHAMSLHWANDPVGQLIQSRLALQPDGLFIGVCPGGNTLSELRASLSQAEIDLYGGLSPRVAPMAEIRDLGALLQRAGFALPVADCLPFRISYASPLHLMHELRFMAENNALVARRKSFMPRALLDRACEIYQTHFGQEDGRITATFELMVLTGWAPAPDQPQPLRPGSATTRLADALGTQETKLKD